MTVDYKVKDINQADFQQLKQAAENLLRRTHLVEYEKLAEGAAPATESIGWNELRFWPSGYTR